MFEQGVTIVDDFESEASEKEKETKDQGPFVMVEGSSFDSENDHEPLERPSNLIDIQPTQEDHIQPTQEDQ
jgi:hypothetical protein